MSVPLIYFLVCLVLAVLGRKHRFGFWGILFASFLLTPFIGLLLLLGAQKRKEAAS